MRQMNQDIFRKWTQLAATGQMVGKDRPIGRVSIAENTQKQVHSSRPGPWRHVQFQSAGEMELPGVKSIEIDRSIGNDTATCTITLYNDAPTVDVVDTDWNFGDGLASWRNGTGFGRPGYLSPTRGTSHTLASNSIYNKFLDERGVDTQEQGIVARYRNRWGYETNEWYGKIIPNRLIRTFQGYGSDSMDDDGNLLRKGQTGWVPPWSDTKLVITGTWLIDTVELSTEGMVVLQCRDLGKLLLEQVVYPPMLPLSRFPLMYCPETPSKGRKGERSKNRIHYHSAAVNLHARYRPNGVYGHRPQNAFDGRPGTYFLGHSYSSPSGGYSKEWIQGTCRGNKINQIEVDTVGAGYVVYVSVMERGQWKGANSIPYDTGGSHSHGAGIPYVARHTMGKASAVIRLPRTYDAGLVRLTFTNLRNFGLAPLPYRVGVRAIRARYQRKSTFKKGTMNRPGHISDWSEAIKELAGWAGFTWKTDIALRGGSSPTPLRPDPLLGRQRSNGQPLRIWGDIEDLGAGPIECTPSDFFLNKTFMECFVGETPIQTSDGLMPIKDVKEGQRVLNAAGLGTVTHTRSVQKRRLVRVEVDGEVFHCSEEHPFFTARGWIPASGLVRGDQLVSQREAVHLVQDAATQGEQAVLRAHLSAELDHRAVDEDVPGLRRALPRPELAGEVLLEDLHVRWQAEAACSTATVRGMRQGVHAESLERRGEVQVLLQRMQGAADEPGSGREGGDRALGEVRARRASASTVPALAGTGRESGGLVRPVLDDTAWGDSRAHVLHGGRGEPGGEDRRRGGRPEPYLQRDDRGPGPASGGLDGRARVDRVEILEPGSPGWVAVCGDSDQVTLYDLTVSGHPSFSIGEAGHLVHNCCKAIADFLGCLFFIDEYGGIIFRFPNLWSGGNFMTDPEGPLTAVRTDSPSVYRRRQWPIELHESANLINYSVTLDDSQVRSEVMVVGTNPDTNSNAQLAGGIRLVDTKDYAQSRTVNFTEVLAGQQRMFLVPGEQTKGFTTREECQRMAELIGVKILWSYRKGTATIPGHPGLQLDDQVRIFERISHENNFHYVSGISSRMDVETGEYLMDVTTHWLGGNPDRDWVLKRVQLTKAVTMLPAIIRRLGKANPGGKDIK